MPQQPLDTLLHALREQYALPALAAAVVRGTAVVAASAVGVRRIAAAEQVTPQDRFHLGSVTKPLTATMIAALVEQGQLSWATTVGEAFPSGEATVHPALRGVTLAQLLAHRAGIQPFEEDGEFAAVPAFGGTPMAKRQAFVRWLLQRAPVVTPGVEQRYSNAGYTIAAAMAERRAGAAWETLMRQHLFAPLGLATAGFGWPARRHPQQPWGHRARAGGPVPHDPHDAYQLEDHYLGPAGDAHMSVADLARFAQLHLRGLRGEDGVLRAATIQRLHAAPVGDYALGWNIRPFGDHHLGSAETFFAVVLVSPADDLAYTLATNYALPDSAALASELLSALRGRYRAQP